VKNSNSTLRLLGSLVALIGLVGLVAAVPATAAKLSGKTVLTPNSDTVDALASLGVEVSTSGDAKLNQNGIVFPIASGKIVNDAGDTKIVHTGGLTFSGMGTALEVENFVLKIGKQNVLKATIAGGDKITFADLNVKKIKVKDKPDQVVVSNVTASLSKDGAKVLSETFGIDEDLKGAELGAIKSKVDL